jgi:hypothetical protein
VKHRLLALATPCLGLLCAACIDKQLQWGWLRLYWQSPDDYVQLYCAPVYADNVLLGDRCTACGKRLDSNIIMRRALA